VATHVSHFVQVKYHIRPEIATVLSFFISTAWLVNYAGKTQKRLSKPETSGPKTAIPKKLVKRGIKIVAIPE
jgi:hypothetical protein